MNDRVTRRAFSKTAVKSVVTFTLIDTLCRSDLFSAEVKPVTVRWLRDLDAIGRELKSEKLKQAEWKKKVEELLARVELSDLMSFIEFDRILKDPKLVERGARSHRFEFLEIDGAPAKLVFGKQIFALGKGRSVAPHGHNNMATAFLILGGKFHGRHYDRLEDEEKHLIIKPTIDRTFGAGEYSTVTDHEDNIHWFRALEEPAFIFNIHILGLDPGSTRRTGRVYVDPNGEKIKDGRVRARRIDHEEATRLYG